MTGGVPEGAPPVVMLCCVVLLVAPLVFLAPEAPAAAWPALMGRAAVCAGGGLGGPLRAPGPAARPPPPRPDPLVPSGPSGTLRTGGPGVLSVICVGSLSGQA